MHAYLAEVALDLPAPRAPPMPTLAHVLSHGVVSAADESELVALPLPRVADAGLRASSAASFVAGVRRRFPHPWEDATLLDTQPALCPSEPPRGREALPAPSPQRRPRGAAATVLSPAALRAARGSVRAQAVPVPRRPPPSPPPPLAGGRGAAQAALQRQLRAATSSVPAAVPLTPLLAASRLFGVTPADVAAPAGGAHAARALLFADDDDVTHDAHKRRLPPPPPAAALCPSAAALRALRPAVAAAAAAVAADALAVARRRRDVASAAASQAASKAQAGPVPALTAALAPYEAALLSGLTRQLLLKTALAAWAAPAKLRRARAAVVAAAQRQAGLATLLRPAFAAWTAAVATSRDNAVRAAVFAAAAPRRTARRCLRGWSSVTDSRSDLRNSSRGVVAMLRRRRLEATLAHWRLFILLRRRRALLVAATAILRCRGRVLARAWYPWRQAAAASARLTRRALACARLAPPDATSSARQLTPPVPALLAAALTSAKASAEPLRSAARGAALEAAPLWRRRRFEANTNDSDWAAWRAQCSGGAARAAAAEAANAARRTRALAESRAESVRNAALEAATRSQVAIAADEACAAAAEAFLALPAAADAAEAASERASAAARHAQAAAGAARRAAGARDAAAVWAAGAANEAAVAAEAGASETRLLAATKAADAAAAACAQADSEGSTTEAIAQAAAGDARAAAAEAAAAQAALAKAQERADVAQKAAETAETAASDDVRLRAVAAAETARRMLLAVAAAETDAARCAAVEASAASAELRASDAARLAATRLRAAEERASRAAVAVPAAEEAASRAAVAATRAAEAAASAEAERAALRVEGRFAAVRAADVAAGALRAEAVAAAAAAREAASVAATAAAAHAQAVSDALAAAADAAEADEIAPRAASTASDAAARADQARRRLATARADAAAAAQTADWCRRRARMPSPEPVIAPQQDAPKAATTIIKRSAANAAAATLARSCAPPAGTPAAPRLAARVLSDAEAADAALEATWRESDWWASPWPPPALLRRGRDGLPRTPGAAAECVYGRALARRVLAALSLEAREGRAMAEAALAFDRGRRLRFALQALISRRNAQRDVAVAVQSSRRARQLRGWLALATQRKAICNVVADCRRRHAARRILAALRFWAQHAADRKAKAAAAASAQSAAVAYCSERFRRVMAPAALRLWRAATVQRRAMRATVAALLAAASRRRLTSAFEQWRFSSPRRAKLRRVLDAAVARIAADLFDTSHAGAALRLSLALREWRDAAAALRSERHAAAREAAADAYRHAAVLCRAFAALRAPMLATRLRRSVFRVWRGLAREVGSRGHGERLARRIGAGSLARFAVLGTACSALRSWRRFCADRRALAAAARATAMRRTALRSLAAHAASRARSREAGHLARLHAARWRRHLPFAAWRDAVAVAAARRMLIGTAHERRLRRVLRAWADAARREALENQAGACFVGLLGF